MSVRIGSLCTGYGGLDMAVESVLGGELAWVADNDPGAAAILAHRFPSVPNLTDITVTDWSAVEPVDVLTAGFPCQDVSCAGGRAGLREGNRTGVWAHVARAIDALRPSLVVLENVRGLLSAGADSDMELCPWCLGEAGDELALRASGAVLGDLADLGYDAQWVLVSAASVGAPHRRERVFFTAWPAADTTAAGEGWWGIAGSGTGGNAPVWHQTGCQPRDSGGAAENTDRTVGGQRGIAAPGQAAPRRPRADAGGSGGTRNPDFQSLAADAPSDRRDTRRAESARLVGGPDAAQRGDGTPADTDGSGRRAEQGPTRGRGCGGLRAPGCEPGDSTGGSPAADPDGTLANPTGVGHGDAGPTSERGLPPATIPGAPADPDGNGLPRGQERDSEPLSSQAGHEQRRVDPLRRVLDWGIYGPAIARWEAILGRPAPRPTEPGRTGERLSPRFVEWMQGLPDGWVTDVPGLSRNAQLRALGNGVVPQQAVAALRLLLPVQAEAAA